MSIISTAKHFKDQADKVNKSEITVEDYYNRVITKCIKASSEGYYIVSLDFQKFGMVEYSLLKELLSKLNDNGFDAYPNIDHNCNYPGDCKGKCKTTGIVVSFKNAQ